MDWSNEATLEFLRLYELEPVIWNPKEPLHKNRTAVADAWKRIEASISMKCSVQELKKKKESLMASFRPLLSRVKASMKTRKGADEVYRPTWFAFETMAKFLGGVYQPRSTINTKVR
jgi:Alcohol dehydrogenase transcription factor Myb/SANT-like.